MAENPERFGLYHAKVWDVHPEHNAVDVTMLHDRRRLVGVPVISMSASGNTGVIDLPIPTLTTGGEEKWESQNTKDRDIVAIIGFSEGTPICFGFIYPPVSQMNFEGEIAQERRIQRHASDVYETIDKDGNCEFYHPSGTFLRFAEDPEHFDLSGKDYDKKWNIKKNKDKKPYIRLEVHAAGEKKARITVSPKGEVEVLCDDQVAVNTQKGVDVIAQEDVTVDTQADVKVTAQGDVSVDAGGEVSITAGSGVTITAGGEITVAGSTVNVMAAAVNVTAPLIDLIGIVAINGTPRGMSGMVF